jgi:hypothetical protein
MLYLCGNKSKTYNVMTKLQREIESLERTIKFIFYKKHLTQDDVTIGNKLINQWKKLTRWVERTENPIKFI